MSISRTDEHLHLTYRYSSDSLKVIIRSAQNRLTTIRLPEVSPETGIKSDYDRVCERWTLADFRPTFCSRMVAKRFRTDLAVSVC
jgi:hypothetical protein